MINRLARMPRVRDVTHHDTRGLYSYRCISADGVEQDVEVEVEVEVGRRSGGGVGADGEVGEGGAMAPLSVEERMRQALRSAERGGPGRAGGRPVGTPGSYGMGRSATAGPSDGRRVGGQGVQTTASASAGGSGRKAGSRTLDKLWVGAKGDGAGSRPLSETPTAGARLVASGRTRPYTDKEMRLINLFRRAHDKSVEMKGVGENSGTAGSRPGTAGSRPGTTMSRPGTTMSRPGTTMTRPGTTMSRPGTTMSRPGTANTLREKRLEAARLGERVPSLDEVRMGIQKLDDGSRPSSVSSDATVAVDEGVLRLLGLSPRGSLNDAEATPADAQGGYLGSSTSRGKDSSPSPAVLAPTLPPIAEVDAEDANDALSVATSDEWRDWDQPEVLNLENFPDSQLPLGVLEQELREQLRTSSGPEDRPADEDLMPKVEIDIGAWKLLHPPADMSMPVTAEDDE